MTCIIPARGGSKRLPGKNLRKLDGEFIINRVIQTAHESEIFDNIIVSTDSKQIADIVIGATVSMRPENISGDIPEDDVLKWTAHKYWALNICRIYPFAVLLTSARIQNGYQEFITGKYENVHECQKYGHSPLRMFQSDGTYAHPSIVSLPTEEVLDLYHDAATFMFTHVGTLDKSLAERNIKWIPVHEWEAQDLDDADDWEMLEMKWKYQENKAQRELIFRHKIGE